jgi:hypothetical protein
MIAPELLGFGEAAADTGHIVGPIIMTFSIVAWWEATDVVIKWNYPFAAWLLLAPWILGYEQIAAIFSDSISGLLVIILCTVKRKVENHYGGGWTALWK